MRASWIPAARRHWFLRLGAVWCVLLVISPTPVRAQRPLSDQQILQYLSQAISWHRDVTALVQTPAGPEERLFADDLRNSSTEAVRLAFDFARAAAAMASASPASEVQTSGRGRNLAQAEAEAEQTANAAQAEIEQTNRQLLSAPARDRVRLLAQREELASEVNFAKARRDALRTLISFLSVPGEGGLASKIGDLERAVPEIAAPRQKTASPATPSAAAAGQDFHPESAGLVSLTTEIFSTSRKMSVLGHLAEEADDLRAANQTLRAPLRAALQSLIRQGDALAQQADTATAEQLNAERKQLDALSAQFKQVSASAVPLSEQLAQINNSRGQLVEWRGVVDEDYRGAVQYLLLRAGMLVIGLAVILGLSELWRRATIRYVRELRRQRQFLLLRRIVIGCTITLFLILSFMTEFGSLATFAGFAAAGLAVAMQSVLLSMVAYFFLVGRWGVRVGDRVTVSGVTGEVVDIGLFRLYLMELGGAELPLEPTGRIVVFPNAIFFQPSAMFKQFPGLDYTWRTVTLRLAGAADSKPVENRLRAAVDAVYGEYRETIEKQHRAANASLNLHTPAPSLESRVRYVDSNLEVTLRYPVPITRVREVDDRVSRNLLEEAGREPKLTLVDSSTALLEAKAG